MGDSILGYKAHMGAGAVTSNVKADKTPVTVKGETKIETGLKKLGSMIGDFAEVGCNAVLNPGTVVQPRIYAHGRTSVPAPIMHGPTIFAARDTDAVLCAHTSGRISVYSPP